MAPRAFSEGAFCFVMGLNLSARGGPVSPESRQRILLMRRMEADPR